MRPFPSTAPWSPPEGVDKGWFQLFITILNYLYWVGGALLGSIAGAFLPFDTTGIDLP